MKCVENVFDVALFNPLVCWYAGGVPLNQLKLIWKDKTSIVSYMARSLNSVMENSHISGENYFYYNIFNGKYHIRNCPQYLKKESVLRFKKENLLERLTISTDYFIEELKKQTYDKVILMDHVDWLTQEQISALCHNLWEQVNPGGKVIFRSAALEPSYVNDLKDVGFQVTCVGRIDQVGYMDRVNMYASFYLATKATLPLGL